MKTLFDRINRISRSEYRPILFHPVNPVKNYFLSSTDSQHQFHAWFYKELNGLARVIKATNPRNPRIHPGKEWGHGTKIMALYVRDIVLVSRYFYDSQVNGNHGAQGDELARSLSEK